MNEVLVSAGAASIILAVVGGGAKAFGVDVPIITSIRRQAALALVGVGFLVSAVLLREEAGPSGPSEEIQGYRQDVLTACDSLTFSSLPFQPSYESGEVQEAWRSDIQTYRSVFRDLWAEPAPDELREDAAKARNAAKVALARMEQVFTRVGNDLPATVDPPTLQAAAATAGRELSQPLTRLEARMSKLARRDCNLVGSQ